MSESERNVVDEVKRYSPASLKVTLRDGTEKPVAVPKSRNRWSRCQQVLDAMPWVAIECLDKDGRVLGVIEDDEELDAMVEETGDSSGSNVAMARTLLEVMRSTMKETRLMFEVQMKGQAELVEALIAGVRSISESYELSLQANRAATIAEAASSAGAGGLPPEILMMLQMAMQPKRVAAPAAAAAKDVKP